MFRPYKLLSHSERQLTNSADEFVRADVVLNLKRAINSRLQHIEELYAFSKDFPKNIGALERLETVGLARPLLIRKLFSLRNDIEHNDVLPPDARKCTELIDATWYFLKTTDSACKTVPRGVILKNPVSIGDHSRSESITIRVPAANSEVEFKGILSAQNLSAVEKTGYFSIDEAYDEFGYIYEALAFHAKHTNPNYQDIGELGLRRFFGKATLPMGVKHALWKRMLETL